MAPRAKAKRPELSFIFTPQGFVCDVASDPTTGEPNVAPNSVDLLDDFTRDRYAALLDLGFREAATWFTPSMRFLHRLAYAFLRDTLQQPDIEFLREQAPMDLMDSTAQELLLALPFTPGAEHVDTSWLGLVWGSLADEFRRQLAGFDGTVDQFVTTRTQDLRVPGRIFFHLVENKRDAAEGYPFAFLATYASQEESGVRHFPLRYALEQHRGDQRKVLSLLADLSEATQASAFVSDLVESGELFHPLRMDEQDAYTFLKDVPAIEAAGVLCRVPTWWKRGASGVKVNVRIGQTGPEEGTTDALLRLVPSFMVDGIELSEDEIRDLLARTEGLAFIKGRWVEVDHDRLQKLLDAFDQARDQSLSIFDAMREAAGGTTDSDLVEVSRGEWLDQLVSRMRTPARIDDYQQPAGLDATLRPYQRVGYSWMCYLQELGFGACLADDMGLGKTIQLIAFLEHLRETQDKGVRALLVVPASLIGNWQHELERFAPDLDFQVLHGTSAPKLNARFAKIEDAGLKDGMPTLSITTYQMAQRLEVVSRMGWDVLVLDEAQAIKNPGVKQTRAIKALDARMRVALTGTPVENDLSNLWSIFDFLNPGMLGTLKEFKRYVSALDEAEEGYGALRQLTAPFLLRRLKTDRSIISDLPDKAEIDQYVTLTRKQVVLYRQCVQELERSLREDETSDIQRRGLVLATISRLKQICNHPDQYLGQDAFAAKDSGKFLMLTELCETIYEKRERVLVFTQFREMCTPLARLLEGVFERPGLIIHGGVSAAKRTQIVERFQSDEYIPFMVLSLRAAGTGLNLTAANNVIHFDRWWNPAVENQATDRAFRIGQTKNVMVHKMISENTLEERIDEIIQGKSDLVSEVVGEGETWLGNLSNDQLTQLLRFGDGR